MANWTEQQVQEAIRCVQDPVYCLDMFTWLDSDYGIIPFTVGKSPEADFYYQYEVVQHLVNKENVMVLKARRVGLSWIAAFWAFWLINFHRGKNVLFLSRKESDAISLVAKVKFILMNLAYKDSNDITEATPANFLKNRIVIDKQQMLGIGHLNEQGEVSSISKVTALTTTKRSGQGEKAEFVFVDEVHSIENQEEVFAAALLTAARNGYWLMGGSAGVWGSRSHHICLMAEAGENKHFWYRKVLPQEAGIDQETIERASETLTEAMIQQEWYLQFSQPGNPVFDITHLSACFKPPDMFPEIEQKLTEYRQNVQKNLALYKYFSGVDSAMGKAHKKSDEKDYNCFIALTRDGIQAFTYMDKEPLSKWAGTSHTQANGQILNIPGKTSELHIQWPGLCTIEENGPGMVVISRHQVPMDGISEMRLIDIKHHIKSRIIKNLIIAIESHSIILTDQKTFQQLSMYQYGETPDTYECPKGFNDDACLKKGTLIKTDRGYKPIETIKVGDMVLTHTGKYQPVEVCFERQFNGLMYRVHGIGQLPMELTYNHPLYAATYSYEKYDSQKWKKRKWILPGDWKSSYGVIGIKPCLKPNQEIYLNCADFYKLSKYAANHKLPYIKLDKEFAKFLGLFLAEGNCRKTDYSMSLAFNKKEIDLIEFSTQFLNSLGIATQMQEKDENGFVVLFSSKFLHAILSKCYDKNREKILPEYAHTLGTDLCFTLEYWLKGDGWNSKGHEFGATTSKALALEMRDIALACGHKSTIQEVKRHRYEVETKTQYWTKVTEWTNADKLQKISDFEVASKAKLRSENYKGTVYNLQVANDNSYIADGIVVHNCLSLAEAFDGLMLEGGYELVLTSGKTLETLDMTPYDKAYHELIDLKHTAVAPAMAYRVPEGTRLSSYMPLPMEELPSLADPRFMVNQKILEQLYEKQRKFNRS